MTVSSPDLVAIASHAPASARACLNCGAPLGGKFCMECGQRDVPPYPTLRELVAETFSELSGWDGRFVATLRALVLSPGKLTREFLEGRRVRYISPLRLYLFASVVYFLVTAAAPETKNAAVAVKRDGVAVQSITPAERDSILAATVNANGVVKRIVNGAAEDPAAFKARLTDYLPRALFALVPVFAGLLSLVYRHRRYPEHLYFALHLHAFVFLALTVRSLATYSQNLDVIGLGEVIALGWILVYGTVAARRTYGGSLIGTWAKGTFVFILYAIVSCLAMLGVALSAAIFA